MGVSEQWSVTAWEFEYDLYTDLPVRGTLLAAPAKRSRRRSAARNARERPPGSGACREAAARARFAPGESAGLSGLRWG
ncbi:hypothetical protein GCM10010307_60310 [Streptomyces vastus]|uniref:Uncharacterized protein n=1 Tax=Streptomyces vastus TaxID=285451 RepID=A0ABN3RF74_9ACTN